MKNYNAAVYEDPEVRQALAQLFVELNEQQPKDEQQEIPEEIQDLSGKKKRSLSTKFGRRHLAV